MEGEDVQWQHVRAILTKSRQAGVSAIRCDLNLTRGPEIPSFAPGLEQASDSDLFPVWLLQC